VKHFIEHVGDRKRVHLQLFETEIKSIDLMDLCVDFLLHTLPSHPSVTRARRRRAIWSVGPWPSMDARHRAAPVPAMEAWRRRRPAGPALHLPSPHPSPHSTGRRRPHPDALRRRAPAAMSKLTELWPRVDADAVLLHHGTPARVTRHRCSPATPQPQGHVPVSPGGPQRRQ
jgi:hypothetical protein